MISESKVSAAWLGQRIPPEGDLWKRETYGMNYPQLFSSGRFDNSVPNIDLQGYGNVRGASGSLLSPTTDIMATQTLTYVRGEHTFKGGTSIIRNRVDQNGRSNYAGFVNFNTAGNNRTTGNAFADALLGNFRTYSEANGDPIGFFRFTQVDAFVTDNWRIGNKLTVDARRPLSVRAGDVHAGEQRHQLRSVALQSGAGGDGAAERHARAAAAAIATTA